MAILLGGTSADIKNATYNGVALDKINYNGITVWQKSSFIGTKQKSKGTQMIFIAQKLSSPTTFTYNGSNLYCYLNSFSNTYNNDTNKFSMSNQHYKSISIYDGENLIITRNLNVASNMTYFEIPNTYASNFYFTYDSGAYIIRNFKPSATGYTCKMFMGLGINNSIGSSNVFTPDIRVKVEVYDINGRLMDGSSKSRKFAIEKFTKVDEKDVPWRANVNSVSPVDFLVSFPYDIYAEPV